MMKNEVLKEVRVYKDNDKYFMAMTYEYEKNGKVYTRIYPKVAFPFRSDVVPDFRHDLLPSCSYDGCAHLSMHTYDDQLMVYKAAVATVDGHCYKDVYYIEYSDKPEECEMTIEEIEKKLGCKIKIVSEKRKND